MPDLAIVVVDDHPIVRDGLSQVLAIAPGLRVLGACSDRAEAIDAVARHRPDILLLDPGLPDGDGVAAIPAILGISPRTHIILFTAMVGEERAVEALRLGAKAVLLKNTPAEQLIKTIHAVGAGIDWIAPVPITSQAGLEIADPGRLATLTPREREVAEWVARGVRNKQIAWQLGVAEGTVKLHISRAFRKLGVDTRVGLSRALSKASAG